MNACVVPVLRRFLGKELRTTGYPEGGTSFPVIFDKSNGTDEAARAS